MKKIIDKIKGIKKQTVIKNSFLLPILLVVFISISHVVSWYDLGNPLSWAIYLSVAVEVFALASVAAAGINVSRASIWTLFGLVTSIQIIGNIFFIFQDINVASDSFIAWVELIKPWFEDWDITDHRRLLSYIQGGTLPIMSLIALHYFIKFNDIEKEQEKKKDIPVIKTKPFPKEVLQKIYDDHSNVDPNDLAQNIKGPTSHNGEDGISSKDGIVENEELFDSSNWFKRNEEHIDSSEVTEELVVEDNKQEDNGNLEPDSKIDVLEKDVESLELAEETTSVDNKEKLGAESSNEVILPEDKNDSVIVEKITKSPKKDRAATQWAGGSNPNTFQNPQAMPGVN